MRDWCHKTVSLSGNCGYISVAIFALAKCSTKPRDLYAEIYVVDDNVRPYSGD